MEVPLHIEDESEYQVLLSVALLPNLTAAENDGTPNLDPAIRINEDSVAAWCVDELMTNGLAKEKELDKLPL